jgi:hypothetical protein
LTSRIRSSSAASFRSSIERCPSSSKRRGGFAPEPGTRVTSISVGGNFAFSFTAAGISPVSSSASIFLGERLADAGDLGRPPFGASSATETGLSRIAFARGAVGEHPVFDRPSSS